MPHQAQVFGEWVRIQRERAGLSGPALAARIGWSKQFQHLIERGGSLPSDGGLVSLADALSLGPDLVRAAAGRLPGDLVELLQADPAKVAEIRRLLGG